MKFEKIIASEVKSMHLFKALYVSTDFLSLSSLLLLIDGYIARKKKGVQVRLLKDAPERKVAQIQEYILVLSMNNKDNVCLKW